MLDFQNNLQNNTKKCNKHLFTKANTNKTLIAKSLQREPTYLTHLQNL